MTFKPFPSATIARYTARMFLVRVIAFLVALVVILQTLDLLTESNKILAVATNGDAELWHYVTLRMPQLIAQFLPFSVLLGTLVTLATLNQNSEVVIFKAAGISAHQFLAPLIIAALGVSVISFAFNELVLTHTNKALKVWQDSDYGAEPGSTAAVAHEVWVRDKNSLFHAQHVSGTGTATRLSDVTVYQRNADQLQFMIRAAAARPVAGGWELTDVRRFDVLRGKETQLPRLLLDAEVQPSRFTVQGVIADQTPFWELRRDIASLAAAGKPTASLEVALMHKLSGPLSAMLMPIVGAVAAFGLARSGKLFIRSVIGMALGFTYFVADNFMVAMGQFGAAPPWLAAWAPFLLFYLIGEAVLFRTEE